jgi:LysR family transcriptional regulator (chromosome initiation inhibitor)
MWNYDLLHALEVVCREGSFERAAKKLHITQSAVSQRIRSLEDSLGQRVINRGPPLAPTQVGQTLMTHVQNVALLETELEKGISFGSGSRIGRIAIAVNADSLALWFLNAITPALKEHDILVELIVDDESYTHELLERGQVIGCVSTRSDTYVGCEKKYLGAMRYTCAATKTFAKQYFPKGITADGISKAPSVAFNRKDQILENILAQIPGCSNTTINYHYIPSTEQFFNLIKLGQCYGPVSHLQLPKSGLKILSPKHHDVKLYWHSWRHHSSILTKVEQAIVKHANNVLA